MEIPASLNGGTNPYNAVKLALNWKKLEVKQATQQYKRYL